MDSLYDINHRNLLETARTPSLNASNTTDSLPSIFRRKTLARFSRFQADDWLMVLVLLPYTASIVSTNRVGSERSTRGRIYRFVLEETQIVTLWLIKACLLILYWRIL
jgi:hypothetical protein